MSDIKHLVSPFVLVPPSVPSHAKKATPRQAPPCNCDSDDENDFGMAPECAFVCSASLSPNKGKNKSKKQSKRSKPTHATHATHAKTKTRRRTKH
jgi:hypothetical protein